MTAAIGVAKDNWTLKVYGERIWATLMLALHHVGVTIKSEVPLRPADHQPADGLQVLSSPFA